VRGAGGRLVQPAEVRSAAVHRVLTGLARPGRPGGAGRSRAAGGQLDCAPGAQKGGCQPRRPSGAVRGASAGGLRTLSARRCRMGWGGVCVPRRLARKPARCLPVRSRPAGGVQGRVRPSGVRLRAAGDAARHAGAGGGHRGLPDARAPARAGSLARARALHGRRRPGAARGRAGGGGRRRGRLRHPPRARAGVRPPPGPPALRWRRSKRIKRGLSPEPWFSLWHQALPCFNMRVGQAARCARNACTHQARGAPCRGTLRPCAPGAAGRCQARACRSAPAVCSLPYPACAGGGTARVPLLDGPLQPRHKAHCGRGWRRRRPSGHAVVGAAAGAPPACCLRLGHPSIYFDARPPWWGPAAVSRVETRARLRSTALRQ